MLRPYLATNFADRRRRILQPHPILQGAEVMPNVQPPRRPHPAQNPAFLRVRPCRQSSLLFSGKSAGQKPGLYISTGLPQQLAGDDHALHFARPLINRNHTRVAVHALHIGLPGIPHGAMCLHRFIHHAIHHLAGIKLCLRSTCAHFGRVRVLQPCRVVCQSPRGFDLRLHVRNHPLNRLELADVFSKRLPLLRILDGFFQRSLRQTDRLRRKSSALKAIFNPWPSSPSRFSTGTTQSFSKISTEGDDRCPILSSCRPTRNPANPGSTKNAEIPLPPATGSVFANTISTPAALPFVTQVFVPFNL